MSIADWLRLKTEIVAAIGLERDAMHIYVSVLIQFAVALFLRRGLAHWLPLLAVLIAACGNEFLDLQVETWPEPDEQLAESVRDIVNSMLMPALLFAVARWSPAAIFPSPRT